MKEKFLSEHILIRMSQNSLVFKNKYTGDSVWIHRNVFNHLDEAVEYRIVTKESTHVQKWVEGLFWKSL
jgi:hypothetical protein